jgi:hypothetical protein
MYAVDTILTLKKQRDPDPETGEAFPYNEVRVIGESPISHSHKGDYTGADAAGVILSPVTNFAGTLDEPFGKCRALYDVKSIPEPQTITQAPVRVIDATSAQAGPTPEEVFADEAPGTAPEPGQKRGRTLRPSPLGETKNEAASGPLGDAPAIENETPPAPEAPASPLDAPQGTPPPEVPESPASPLDE